MKPVSTSTEQALRGALTRLVSGKTGTDGRLTVANLAREAGVSRATANRAPAILAELRGVAAEAARLSRLEKPRSPQFDAERNQRELENVIAQHVQVRALLQRASESRRSRLAPIPLVEDGG